MANERDVKDKSASTIWRTVVFAGAMLSAPLAGADRPSPPAPPPPPAPQEVKTAPVKLDPAQEKAKRIETLDGERKALLAKLIDADSFMLDGLKREIAAK